MVLKYSEKIFEVEMVSRIKFEQLIVEAAGKQRVSRTQLDHLPQLTMNSLMGVTSKCWK